MKKLSKKQVDIESEFIGKSVGPSRKKEKKDDLTDEITKFLNEPISLETIKRVFMRMGGFSKNDMKKFIISIFRINAGFYIITIKKQFFNDSPLCLWYLGPFTLYSLCYFSAERIDKSRLREKFAHVLRCWFAENTDKITNIG